MGSFVVGQALSSSDVWALVVVVHTELQGGFLTTGPQGKSLETSRLSGDFS